MRIVGGTFRGRHIASPKGDDPVARLRPTSDRMREAIFNILGHGDWPALQDARVLDLFAGTGALGFEALSRGAARVLFVDEGAESRALIRQNIDTFNVIGQTKLYRRDATKLGPHRGDAYDVVFLDPPYRRGLVDKALNSALEGGWIAPEAVIICETAADEAVDTPSGLIERDVRRYGEGMVRFLVREASRERSD